MAKMCTPNGFGKEVPPHIEHVIIYFLQKGQNKLVAIEFFHHYSIRKWKNQRGKKVRNWKIHAWAWVWSRESCLK